MRKWHFEKKSSFSHSAGGGFALIIDLISNVWEVSAGIMTVTGASLFTEII